MMYYRLVFVVVGFFLTGPADCQAVTGINQTTGSAVGSTNTTGAESAKTQNNPTADAAVQNSIITIKDITLNEPVEIVAKEIHVMMPMETISRTVNGVTADAQTNQNDLGSTFNDQSNLLMKADKSKREPVEIVAKEIHVMMPMETISRTVNGITGDAQTNQNDLGSTFNDQSDLLMKADKSKRDAIQNKNAAIINPTNNIKLAENAWTISSVESNIGGTSVEGASMETDVKANVNESQTPTQVVNAMTEVASFDQSQSLLTPSSTTVAVESASTTAESPQIKYSTTSAVKVSTQGTVAPTVTNVGKTNTDDGTNIFKSDPANRQSKGNKFITTTVTSFVDVTSVTADNNITASQSNTTLNVIVPTLSQTTEFTRNVSIQPTTTSPEQRDTNSTTVAMSNATFQVVSPTVTVSSAVETKIAEASVSETTTTYALTTLVESSVGVINSPGAVTDKPTTPEVTTSQLIGNNDTQYAVKVEIKIAVPETTDSSQTTANVTGIEVTCPNITCTVICKHGRKQDSNGCVTCPCKSSADCPKPLPTPRLLCMMQIRLGQSCSSDVDCPHHRICCPGSCGQSCRRKSSSRSRVLSILRILD